MCYSLNGLCEFSLPPSFFSSFSSPPPFGVFSLVPWLGRYKEIGGIYSLHWNSFSTQNDFLVFILWWGDSRYTVTAPQSLSDKDWFFLFAFEMPSIPTLYQPRMLKEKKKCGKQDDLKSSLIPSPADLYLLIDPFNNLESITILSPDYYSQQCKGELSEGL